MARNGEKKKSNEKGAIIRRCRDLKYDISRPTLADSLRPDLATLLLCTVQYVRSCKNNIEI